MEHREITHERIIRLPDREPDYMLERIEGLGWGFMYNAFPQSMSPWCGSSAVTSQLPTKGWQLGRMASWIWTWFIRSSEDRGLIGPTIQQIIANIDRDGNFPSPAGRGRVSMNKWGRGRGLRYPPHGSRVLKSLPPSLAASATAIDVLDDDDGRA
ncbi:hypothetical protein PIB30_086477 [Stylosanthes scabra]|uniref:Uncharacterized protein n=1 Tax=Stylosanthes scabra TaxID=79078 RepID=A0ABU6WT44_9FABA|nr:hypothetical protein [Stylosanthes scabra]